MIRLNVKIMCLLYVYKKFVNKSKFIIRIFKKEFKIIRLMVFSSLNV